MNGKIVVRPTDASDAPSVNAVLEASYPTLMAGSYDAEVLDWALPLMTKANPHLLVSGTFHAAEVDGMIVGCGGWTCERPGTSQIEPGLGHLRHFGTHPSWVRRGVGCAIYAVCESQAIAAGMRRFECHSSLNGVPFYAALGFDAIGQVAVEFRPGLLMPAMLMRRRIG